MASKQDFAAGLIRTVDALASVADVAETYEGIYFDRGYNSGGTDEIVDADLDGTGITAADVTSIITLLQQVQLFVNAGTVTSADYYSTINNVRERLPGGR